MEIKPNSRMVAQIKRIYQINEQDNNKIAKLNAQIEKLTAERDALQASVEAMEVKVTTATGYTSNQLVKTVVTPLFNEDGTPKTDDKGRQLTSKKYVLIYPDTVVPPTVEPEVVETVEPTEPVIEVPEVETNGSDFDIDAQ